MSTYAESAESVVAECFKRLEMVKSKQFPKNDFQELFATIPHPSGSGHLWIRKEARHKINVIAEQAVSRGQYAGRIDVSEVAKNIGKEISERFFSGQREINAKEARHAGSASIKKYASSISDITHYIPCTLAKNAGVAKFKIGNVVFHETKIGRLPFESALHKYIELNRSSDDSQVDFAEYSDIKNEQVTQVSEYFEKFNWIAEISIKECCPVVSYRQALKVLQSTFDCLHIVLGYSSSKGMNFIEIPQNVIRSGHIAVDDDNVANITSFISWENHSLPTNWWNILQQSNLKQYMECMGSAIVAAHKIDNPSLISKRFLGAASWFGEACREKNTPTSLIKFATAIECLVITDSKRGKTSIFSKRAANLICGLENKAPSKLISELKKSTTSDQVCCMAVRLLHRFRKPESSIDLLT